MFCLYWCQVSWVYIIIWGKSTNELKHGAHLTKTPNTTFTIRGLDACEAYHVAVMVGEPIGIGPVAEKQVRLFFVYHCLSFDILKQ